LTAPSPDTIEREREKVPAWVDMNRLCREICCSSTTVDNWVAQGVLPPARKRGGKLMWKWSEVDDWLTNGPPNGGPDALAERIRNAVKADAA
jgi:predicted DNA-binding transcriptional regulator AlpA